eukprot:9668534-Lingulodinium_polyedra.AAC.1
MNHKGYEAIPSRFMQTSQNSMRGDMSKDIPMLLELPPEVLQACLVGPEQLGEATREPFQHQANVSTRQDNMGSQQSPRNL